MNSIIRINTTKNEKFFTGDLSKIFVYFHIDQNQTQIFRPESVNIFKNMRGVLSEVCNEKRIFSYTNQITIYKIIVSMVI